MISVVALMSEGLGSEVATVGNEGMVGLPIFLGADSSPFHVMARLRGDDLADPGPAPRSGPSTSGPPPGRPAAYLFAGVLRADSPERSVQWRSTRSQSEAHAGCWPPGPAQSDRFFLTQEFLAFMLGVAPQSMGIAVGGLQERALIFLPPGRHADRRSARSGGGLLRCYQIVRSEFSPVLGIARA